MQNWCNFAIMQSNADVAAVKELRKFPPFCMHLIWYFWILSTNEFQLNDSFTQCCLAGRKLTTPRTPERRTQIPWWSVPFGLSGSPDSWPKLPLPIMSLNLALMSLPPFALNHFQIMICLSPSICQLLLWSLRLSLQVLVRLLQSGNHDPSHHSQWSSFSN